MFNSIHPLTEDLDRIVRTTDSLWKTLQNQRIFITGGTGFFGCWLLESFVWAVKKFNLNTTATVLTRNISHFEKKSSYLFNQPSLKFYEGDVKNFKFFANQFDHVIHAATDIDDKTT